MIWGTSLLVNAYRYGFNGMEKDNEVKGVGNALDFDYRIYDSRLGTWLSIDPQAGKYPYFSPYVAFGDNPIFFIDPDGRIIEWANDPESQAKKAAVLELVNKSEIFKAIYEELDKSTVVYCASSNDAYLDATMGQTTKGVFETNGKDINNIILRSDAGDLTSVEEFFHAFQVEQYGVGKSGKREIQEIEAEANLVQILVAGEIGENITSSADASFELADIGFFEELKDNGFKVTEGTAVADSYFSYLVLQSEVTVGQPAYGGIQRKLIPEAFNSIIEKVGLSSDDDIAPPELGFSVYPEEE